MQRFALTFSRSYEGEPLNMVYTGTVIRPEVRLHGCPADGGNLIRHYGDKNVVFHCAACGYTIEEDAGPQQVALNAAPQAA